MLVYQTDTYVIFLQCSGPPEHSSYLVPDALELQEMSWMPQVKFMYPFIFAALSFVCIYLQLYGHAVIIHYNKITILERSIPVVIGVSQPACIRCFM